VKVCPAIVSVAVRALVLGLAVTFQLTQALAVPPAEHVSQLVSLLDVVQEQEPVCVTYTDPFSAPAPGLACAAERE
jgi:hypothetical protein